MVKKSNRIKIRSVFQMSKKTQKSRLYELSEDNLLRLKRIAVVGDIHGDYQAFSSLLKTIDARKDGVIFLGDYADRGPNGVEVIESIDSLMARYPRNVIALKGNHEDYSDTGNPTFHPCDLIYEANEKEGSWQKYFQEKLKPFIDSLYLAALIRNEALFIHGGISSKIKSLDDLRYPAREVESDVLWSDPIEDQGEYPSMRGVGVHFGKDITNNVCRELGIKRIMRSHEPYKAVEGPFYEHDEKIVTISSSSVYGGKPFILFIDTKDLDNVTIHFL